MRTMCIAILAALCAICCLEAAAADVSYYGVCREAKTGEVKPTGYLLEFLRRQAEGLTGHREKLGYPFDGSLWEGRMEEIYFTEGVYNGSDQKKEGTKEDFWASGSWWPFEQSAYLLDGMVRVAALADAPALMEDAVRSFEWVLAHPAKDGDVFTPLSNSETQWPLVVFFRAIWAWGEATGREAEVTKAFARHFAAHKADRAKWDGRDMLAAEGMCKIYERTGDKSLIEDALASYRGTRYCREFGSERRIHDHGVSFCESLKIPALLYLYTGDKALLEKGRCAMEDVFAVNEQADGQISGNEYLSGRDPRQGHETCLAADMTWALGYYLMAEGSVAAADRMERIVYNALPGSCTKDFRRHQYLSSVNQAFCTPFSQSAHFNYAESTWRQYRKAHFPQCCTGNIGRAMPAYVARLWLKDAMTGAPVKMVYGPSTFSGEYRGVKYTLEELDGGYPFGDEARIVYRGGTVEMPLKYRVPSWCDRPDAGKVLVEKRIWKDGDTFTVPLPTKLALKSERNWHWFERGPITFAYAVPSEVVEEEPGDAFGALRIVPNGPWNYALDTNELKKADLKVEFRKSAYPFESPAMVLKVPVCEIEEWRVADFNRFMPDPPLFVHPTGRRTAIELVPYATTLGRITCFPDTVKRVELPVVAAYTSGKAYPYDETKPIEEQVFEPEGWDDLKYRNLYKVPQRTPEVFFDLRDVYGSERGRLAYLMFRFWSDEAGEAVFALGGASRLQAFIDGKEVYRSLPWTEGMLMAPEWFRHGVKKGYNYLLVKCALPKSSPGQFRREWGARLQVFMESSADGAGLRTTTPAETLLARWSEALLALRVDGTGNAALDGNVMCPACGALHGRAADAVWPLTWLWARTGEQKWIDAAKGLVTWTRLNCEREDGSCLNDLNMGWRGTTVFFQAALGKALLRFGDRLDEDTRAEWRGMFDRQTAWLHGWMDDPGLVVNVNYRAAFAHAMEIAYALDGDARHRESGDREARRVLGCIGSDGLLFGEAKPMEAHSMRGNRGVDVGYNMEETLPAMMEWARLRGDVEAEARLADCGAAHLWFVLPDGGIDNSFGSRAYKWTYWGSRTSDGALPLYAALAKRGIRGAARAAALTLGLYEQCTDAKTGLLSGGLDYVAAGEPICIHHTFCHLKTLPDYIEYACSGGEEDSLPCDTPFGLRRFSTTEAALASVGKWRATASANDVYFHCDDGKSTGGGSLTLLYHRDMGPIFAASMAEWSLVERGSMQEQRHDDVTRSFTPRIETVDGTYKSVYDDQVAFGAETAADGSIVFTAVGKLGDRSENIDAHKGRFSLEWKVSEGAVSAKAVASEAAVLVLPVLVRPEDVVSVDGCIATVRKPSGTLTLCANRKFSRVAAQRKDGLAFSPQTGFLAAYLTLPVSPDSPTELCMQGK